LLDTPCRAAGQGDVLHHVGRGARSLYRHGKHAGVTCLWPAAAAWSDGIFGPGFDLLTVPVHPASGGAKWEATGKQKSDEVAEKTMSTIPLTVVGAERLRAELHEMKTVHRPAVIAAIA